MLTKKAKKSLMEWKPINARMMFPRFYSSNFMISLIVDYASTNESTEVAKKTFMEQLQKTINIKPNYDILLIIGDGWQYQQRSRKRYVEAWNRRMESGS